MSFDLDSISAFLVSREGVWTLIGFAGQGLFFSRFLVQWLQSERQRKSVMPVAFWYFSFFGGLVSLLYALHLRNAVFTVGQATGLIVYVRNLWLIWRERRTPPAGALSDA